MNDKEQSSIQLTKGQRFPLTIKRLGINGEGVGYFKKKVVFVKGALPGEEVVVEVTKASQRFTEAKIRKLRKTSQERQAPPCPIYNECGGCQLQHMDYAATLRGKKRHCGTSFLSLYEAKRRKTPFKRYDWYGQSMVLPQQKPITNAEDEWHSCGRLV